MTTQTKPVMRAIAPFGWGPATRMGIASFAVPQPGPNDLQVEVHSASVNPKDWKLNANAGRLLGPAARRLSPIYGDDLAGVVTAIGEKVNSFAVGDRIYGMDMRPRTASLAEVAVIDARRIAPMPPSLSFSEAASLPLAVQTALHGLRDHGQLKAGHSVLIIGAGGGVGTLAVQVAKALGAAVTAVCSERNAQRARELGASEVIDYTRIDIHTIKQRFDVVFDVTSHDTPKACRPLLKPGGRFVSTGGNAGATAAVLKEQALAKAGAARAVNASTVIVESWRHDLEQINTWIEAGALRPVVDCHYPLADAQKAYDYSRSGKARGKIVIDIRP